GSRIAALVVASGALLLEAWWGLANRLMDWKLETGSRSYSFPHPVVPRNRPEVRVEDLHPALLWAIIDAERLEAAARRAGGRSRGRQARARRPVPPRHLRVPGPQPGPRRLRRPIPLRRPPPHA